VAGMAYEKEGQRRQRQGTGVWGVREGAVRTRGAGRYRARGAKK